MTKRCQVFLFIVAAATMTLFPRPEEAGPPAKKPAPKLDFHKGESLFEKGCREAANNRLPEAEQLFRQALEICPVMAGPHVELGKICMVRKDPAGALDHYRQAKEAYRLFTEWKQNRPQGQRPRIVDQGVPDMYNIYFRHLVKMGKGEFVPIRHGTEAQSPCFVGQEGFSKQTTGTNFIKNECEGRLGWMAFFEEYPADGHMPKDGQTGHLAVPPAEVDIPALFYLYLGGAYLMLDRPSEAERELWVGLAKDPSMPGLYVDLSLAQFKQGRFIEALHSARTAKRLGFPLPPAYVESLQHKSGGRVE